MQRILDAIDSIEGFIAEQRSIAGADNSGFTQDEKNTQKASKLFVQSPVLNMAVDGLNALKFAARDLLPSATTHDARLADAKAAVVKAQQELDAQPAPGTDAARAKLQSAKDAVKAIESEPVPSKSAQPSARVVAARANLAAAQRDFDTHTPTTPADQARLDAAKAELRAAEAEAPHAPGVPGPSARLVAARSALATAQREYDAVPANPSTQAKLDAAKAELRAAEAAN